MNTKDNADSRLHTAYISKNELYMKHQEAAAVDVRQRFNIKVKNLS